MSVADGALCIGTTAIVTHILTPAIDTDALVWTVPVSIGTTSFRETSRLVRISHLTLGTETTEPSGCGPTLGRSVTRIVGAGIDGGTADLRERIWFGAWRTGTFGSLVLWQTDSIGTTGVSSTHVHTLVAESVTELGWRTVFIGQTADSSAANHRVSGVSLELSRRTGTPG